MSGTVGSVGGSGSGSADQPDFEFQVLCDTNAGVATKFLRRYKTDSAGVTTKVDTRLDGTTAYAPTGSVASCDASCETAVVLCDNNGSFLRRYNRNPDGTISVVNTTLDGVTAYVPVGIVRRCDSYAIESHIFNVAAGASWTPANIPAGKVLVGLGFSVILGTATVTDADGTAVTLLPANYSDSWNATVNGNLVPPQSIAAAAASRVVVTMSVR